jgi:hypothetical protein
VVPVWTETVDALVDLVLRGAARTVREARVTLDVLSSSVTLGDNAAERSVAIPERLREISLGSVWIPALRPTEPLMTLNAIVTRYDTLRARAEQAIDRARRLRERLDELETTQWVEGVSQEQARRFLIRLITDDVVWLGVHRAVIAGMPEITPPPADFRGRQLFAVGECAPDGGAAGHVWIDLHGPRSLEPVSEGPESWPTVAGKFRAVAVALGYWHVGYVRCLLDASIHCLMLLTSWEYTSLAAQLGTLLRREQVVRIEVVMRGGHRQWLFRPAEAALSIGGPRNPLEWQLELVSGAGTDPEQDGRADGRDTSYAFYQTKTIGELEQGPWPDPQFVRPILPMLTQESFSAQLRLRVRPGGRVLRSAWFPLRAGTQGGSDWPRGEAVRRRSQVGRGAPQGPRRPSAPPK